MALLLDALASVLGNSVEILVLSMRNPPGQHQLTLGISSGELSTIFIGVTFMVIYRSMSNSETISARVEFFNSALASGIASRICTMPLTG